MERTFEAEVKQKLQNMINSICDKFEMKRISIIFKNVKEDCLFSEKDKLIILSKNYLDDYYYCSMIIIEELKKRFLDEKFKVNINILSTVSTIINQKKIITPVIKDKLIELGFKEVVIGTKQEHEINSKDVKINFFGYDIAIGLSARAISYASKRQYRAMAIKL